VTRSKTLALSSFALAGAVALAYAQAPDAVAAFNARHEAMEGVNEAMKPLGAIAKKQAPFDAAVVKKNATVIEQKLGEASKHFTAGSEKVGKTRAKADIWTSREDFDRLMGEARTAAAALAKVSDEAAFRPALGTLGTACKSCHDMYRAPEN
jgi:cytochrome c556